MNHSITKAEFYTCTIRTARTPSLQEVTCEHSSANPSLCSLLIATATRKGSQLLRPPLVWYTSFLLHPAQHPSSTFYPAASQPSIPAQHPSPAFQSRVPAQNPSPASQSSIPAQHPNPHTCPQHLHHTQWQEDGLQCPWDGVRVQAGTTDGHDKQAAK